MAPPLGGAWFAHQQILKATARQPAVAFSCSPPGAGPDQARGRAWTRRQFETGGGVRVTRTATPFDPGLLAEVTRQVEERRGGMFSSGMEYPGRYSRWHMGYVDPCVEIVARGRELTATALNDRGA